MSSAYVRDQPYYLQVIIMCILWAYLASCWNIIGGFAGQLSLGHGIYTAVGAYVAVILFNTFGLAPWLGMFVGGGIAVLLSLVIGFPTFGLRGAYYALATVAIGEAVVVLLNNTGHLGQFLIGGAEGLSVKMVGVSAAAIQFNSKVPYYTLSWQLLFFKLFSLPSGSKIPSLVTIWYALREDEDCRAAMGIDVASQ